MMMLVNLKLDDLRGLLLLHAAIRAAGILLLKQLSLRALMIGLLLLRVKVFYQDLIKL